MIKHLLGRRRGRKKDEQEDDYILLQPFKFADEITQPTEKMAKAFNDAAGMPGVFKDDSINDYLRQNVVRNHFYPFLLSGIKELNGTDKKIWIEAETYDAALLRAQGIAELEGAKLTEIW